MCLPMSKYYRISGKMEFTFFFKFNKLGLSRKREINNRLVRPADFANGMF